MSSHGILGFWQPLNTKSAERVRQSSQPHSDKGTTIRNIYYDTDTYLLIRRSIEKPAYKEKLRIRSYRQADLDSTVFVEMKKNLIRLSTNGAFLFRNVIISYAPELSFAVVILSDPTIISGETYTITVGSQPGEFKAS